MVKRFDIKTIEPGFAVVISQELPKEWAYSPYTNSIFQFDKESPLLKREDTFYRVVATIKRKVGDLPLVEFADPVHNKARRATNELLKDYIFHPKDLEMFGSLYIKGYEEAPGPFTEEDIRAALRAGMKLQEMGTADDQRIEEYIAIVRPKEFPEAIDLELRDGNPYGEEFDWQLDTNYSNIIYPVKVYPSNFKK